MHGGDSRHVLFRNMLATARSVLDLSKMAPTIAPIVCVSVKGLFSDFDGLIARETPSTRIECRPRWLENAAKALGHSMGRPGTGASTKYIGSFMRTFRIAAIPGDGI